MPQTESRDPCLCLATEKIHSWVALSYCWGGQSDFVLNDGTARKMIEGIPLSDFPATLRDAIIITRRLGIRHLWIDALCIKQDSEDDWRRESSRMRDVYREATLTLVAANGSSVNAGIFSKRTSKLDLCQLPWTVPYNQDRLPSGQRERVWMRPNFRHQETEPWPIQQRGWTLQEFVLSSRVLSYSEHRMVWQCSTREVDEGDRTQHPAAPSSAKFVLLDMFRKNDRSLPLQMLRTAPRRLKGMYIKFGPRRAYPSKVDSRWTRLVDDYTTRILTNEMDKLPAIAGLASEFARTKQDTYCAGLWRQELLVGLMWSLDPLSAESKTRNPPTRPAEYRAPSWSWASINGEVCLQPSAYTWGRMYDSYERARIIHVEVSLLTSSNPFGQVKAGHLILSGRLYHIGHFLSSGPTPVSDPLPAVQNFLRKSFLVAPGMKQEFDQQHRPCEQQRFALLQLTAYSDGIANGADYLVLESTASGADVYRRVSCINLERYVVLRVSKEELQNLAADAFRELQEANAKEREVMII